MWDFRYLVHLGDIREVIRKAGLPFMRKLGIHQHVGGKAMNEQHSKDCAGRKGQNLGQPKYLQGKKLSGQCDQKGRMRTMRNKGFREAKKRVSRSELFLMSNVTQRPKIETCPQVANWFIQAVKRMKVYGPQC